MNIIITSRKFKARDILKDFITTEVKSLQKYYDRILSADVILSYQNSRDSIKIAEIILQVPGQTLTATEESDEYKKAVSAAVEKLSRQLSKRKSKKTARIRA
ncbi:MAG: ribosomal subunit interface protein [Ignavibacteria bacterium RIFOXYB2_FULL_35_12]|nr:MAG: ribosomal subunit interface protein [Ignavibacteria bacterium GWA2_36_19]OGU50252.1 MAG: ribosomal subunit interface protein [Ignavibacteria bacterium GWC2_35_8]OGU57969.1 MAG: ribosomal subunit interface protein [Ignavibacteria bacterium GWF2_35_20]OGU79515.1 MAG: ribosomal subunit interface protein [Ignavibacteria bacterium RIFOXYA2_FULL_35_9]OGU90498.1 MAG: ribosomal subunit interface protein [Ignavibacteria bacterium RIFOXYC12_FULL_35_11]OGU91919.1 MAG: ribosomal subunit interface 